MTGTIQMFLIIVIASFVFSLALSRIPLLRVPTAVGYLLFGLLLQTGQIVHLTHAEYNWVSHLGEMGLLFLMFLSGMEVDVAALQPKSWSNSERNPLAAALSIFFGTFLLSFGVGWIVSRFFPDHSEVMMVTLLFATTSLGVIFPILEESGILHTNYGQTLLLSALLADLFTMLLVSYFVSLRTTGQFLDFLIALTILPAMLAMYFLVTRLKKIPSMRKYAGNLQNRVRAAVALLAAAGAFADFTGSEPILGAFLAGILVSAVPFASKDRLRDYFHGLGYGFFIPVFFISVGLSFQFSLFRDSAFWVWVPVLLVAAVAVKVIPAWQLARSFGTRFAVAGGFLLSARLGLAVAAAEIAVRIGALPQFLAQAIILVAILTCLVTPIAFVSLTQNADYFNRARTIE
ncbi:cation:proton antiporter [Alicyclobacillus tolerans]|uniref:cation:proton antiporter n=1 Tax=Alicyclobacillus tolerans TaxID=90970 RepID=UPI001F47F706|nr:cation:proton antiporter [Alicyclobacillus tolerans]MCF8566165.1 cation:proton antiporter [Alicyclobacillus tolerans]